MILEDLITNSNSTINLGTSRVVEVLSLLNNPQNSYKTIHITGTNGKGSTASFIATGLIHAGFKVGKFTSPHIHQINETITVNEENISDTDLVKFYSIVKNIIPQHKLQLSPFELLTVIMFYYFSVLKIDYLVLEVGLGGLNDATNVVNSVIAIITNVGLEHTGFLGGSLVEIARQKAGIIKPQSYVILGSSEHELLNAVKERTTNYIAVSDSYKFSIGLDFINYKTNLTVTFPSDRQNFPQSYVLNLFGKFQALNFLCAYTALCRLDIPASSISFAATNTQLPYRLQLVSQMPDIIMDATHNVAGAWALYQSIAAGYTADEVVIITSILCDKDISSILRIFNKFASSIIFTTISSTDRGLSASQLAKIAADTPHLSFVSQVSIDDPYAALIYAKKLQKKLIIITGSFYLLAYYPIS